MNCRRGKWFWLLKPLLGLQVIWDPGHVPKGVPALRPDLRPWHDWDRRPHWRDQDRPGEPLLQQTPSHLWLAEPVWNVSYFSAGTPMGFQGCGLWSSLLWEGWPGLSFNIPHGLHVSRWSLIKVLTVVEGGWGWGGSPRFFKRQELNCMCSFNQLPWGWVPRWKWCQKND